MSLWRTIKGPSSSYGNRFIDPEREIGQHLLARGAGNGVEPGVERGTSGVPGNPVLCGMSPQIDDEQKKGLMGPISLMSFIGPIRLIRPIDHKKGHPSGRPLRKSI